jgi:hypothetical protein
MRDLIPQPTSVAAERSPEQSDQCILSAPNVRTRQTGRPLLAVRSADPDVFLLWPGAVLDAVMVPQP